MHVVILIPHAREKNPLGHDRVLKVGRVVPNAPRRMGDNPSYLFVREDGLRISLTFTHPFSLFPHA